MVTPFVPLPLQIPTAVLPGLPGPAQTLAPDHHPLHHDAAVWYLRAAVAG